MSTHSLPSESEADFQLALEREKLAALAEFAAGAGHEINNPLTVISGRAQLLLQEETDPERRHALALIIAQAKRVHEMIADLMLFARPPRPETKSFDINKLIDELLVELGPRCARQDTVLVRAGKPGAMTIEADAAQLAAAIRAVCLNAIEALQSGGRIELALETAENEVHITISDSGPGIKPEERRHLFDPFYSARQAGRGLGLGLPKAWRIITNHGGRIEVENQNAPGGGARFTIALPRGTMPPVS
jgi:signal transduction histidine kinase